MLSIHYIMSKAEYLTHWNGARMFHVTVNGLHVNITKLDDEEVSVEYDVEAVFIGKSPRTSKTEFSGGHGPQFDGNTMLLCIRGAEYVYIGDIIYTFTAIAKITKYVSEMGNSDVPYPYAVDILGNYYLMTERVILMGSSVHADPYETYYRSSLITADIAYNPPRSPMDPLMDGISMFYIGGKPYTLGYTPRPTEVYDRMIPDLGYAMYIEYIDGTKKELTREAYISLIEAFGKKMKFRAIDEEVVAHGL
jgi:hypothetical protein